MLNQTEYILPLVEIEESLQRYKDSLCSIDKDLGYLMERVLFVTKDKVRMLENIAQYEALLKFHAEKAELIVTEVK